MRLVVGISYVVVLGIAVLGARSAPKPGSPRRTLAPWGGKEILATSQGLRGDIKGQSPLAGLHGRRAQLSGERIGSARRTADARAGSSIRDF